MENLENDIKKYTEQIELDPTDPIAYNNRGNAKSDLKDYLGAIRDLKKALDLDPRTPQIHYYFAISLIKVGLYKEAINPLEKIKQLDYEFYYKHKINEVIKELKF